jgi:hypothetical protein
VSTPATVSGRALRRWLTYSTSVVTGVAGVLLVLGVIGYTVFWFVLWLAMVSLVGLTLRQNTQLLDDMQRLVAAVGTTEHMMPVVRCAGCHTRVPLGLFPADEPPPTEVALPPGWEPRHGRPYCPGCLARSN